MENSDQQPKQDLVLELNFVPTWARQPPGANPYAHFEKAEHREEHRGPSDHRRGGDRRDRPRPDRDRSRPERRGERRPGGEPGDQRFSRPPRGEPQPGRFQPRPEPLPIDVSFIPERDRLALLVRDLQVSGHAYPLMDLAGRFLSNPESCLVKLEVRHAPGQPVPMKIYQCRECKLVYREKEALLVHTQSAHLDKFFTIEETKVDPPSGNFVCVARCRRTGILLGPPNYHGYTEKVLQVHRERFSHLSLDEYRASIETLRDPELIEKWKQEQTTQTIYKLRDQEAAEPMKKAEAEKYFQEHFTHSLISEAQRVILPATTAQKLEDHRLKDMIREAWNRESRHPFTLSLALRPAFRHMHLHLFKVKNGQTFVSRIRPHPVDPQQTVEPIREVLQYLREHPGCTRQGILEGLRPGLSLEAPEVSSLLNPLRWLVERGHVIEFFNGTLSVPAQPGTPHREPAPAEAPAS
jgi:hypothetical protein